MGTALPMNPPMRPRWPNRSSLWESAEHRDQLLVIGALVFIPFLTSISRVATDFIPTTTNLSWALAYLMLFASIWLRPDLFGQSIRSNIFLMASAGIATLSALWSLTPDLSALRGVLLILNILVGFMVYHHLGLKRTVVLIFGFLLIMQIGSSLLIFAGHPMATDHLGLKKGLYLHKNQLAVHAVLLFTTSLILAAAGWRPMLALATAGLSCFNLVLSGSGTGLIVVVLMTTILSGCVIVAAGSRPTQFFGGLGFIFGALGIAALVLLEIDPFMEVLDALGKDGTLTGRTTLWEFALATFADSPILGIGYFAYWNSPETTATSLWLLTGQQLASFHNNFLDIMVGVGLVGLFVFVMAMLLLLVRTFEQFRVTRDPLLAWPFAYMCFVTIYSMSEYPLYWNNEFQMLMAFIAAASGAKSGAVIVSPVATEPDFPSEHPAGGPQPNPY